MTHTVVRDAPSSTSYAIRLSAILALLPLVYLAVLLWRCHVDIPFGDEWELVPRLEKVHNGTFTLWDIWEQHNEHRPMFSVAFLMLMAAATHWNTAVEIAANVIVAAFVMVVFGTFVWRHWPAGTARSVWLLPLISLFVFSPSQAENWLWGWQLTAFLNVLAYVGGMSLLARQEGRWSRLFGAIACGIVATYSFATGLLFWMTGAMTWWLNPRFRRWPQMAVWLVAAAATLASYFYDYHGNPGHPAIASNFAGIDAFRSYVVYILKYCGSAAASWDRDVATYAGVLAVGLFAWLVFANRRLAGTPAFSFAVLIGLHTMAGAALTGLGRAGFGPDQGLASRYITISTPLWVAIVMLASFRLARPSDGSTGGRPSMVARAALAATIAAIALSTAGGIYPGTQFSEARAAGLRPVRAALITGRDEDLYLRVYPSVEAVKLRRQSLAAWRYSVFRER